MKIKNNEKKFKNNNDIKVLEANTFSTKEFLNVLKKELMNTKTVEIFRYNKNIIEEYDDLEKDEHIIICETECSFKFSSKEIISSKNVNEVDMNDKMMNQIFDQLKLINSKLVEIDGRLVKIESRLDKVEQRLDKVEQRLDKVEQRLDKVEQRLDKVEQRLDKVEKRLDILEHDVRILKDDVAAIKNCPTIKKELAMMKQKNQN